MHNLQLGFGVSAWLRGASTGHLDGIGIYTQALYDALMRMQHIEMTLYAFGQSKPLPCGTPRILERRISEHLIKAMVLRQRLSCRAELFHATDHFIPRLDIPVVATVMDLIPFLHPEWVSTQFRSAKNWLFKQSILSADHIITISNHSKQDLIQHLHIPAEHISVTPLAVSAAYFQRYTTEKCEQILQEYQLSSGFFLFVGTLQPRKNIEGILKAHALLPVELQQRHPIVIVGRNGWGVDHLIPKIRQLETKGCVRWLNYVPQAHVIGLLQSAQALLFASLYEGFGLPVLEAFAAKCPVIASNTTSIPEVACDAALLINPLDEEEISQAMLQCLEEPELIKQLKEKGASRASLFTWDACAQATYAAYQQVIR